MEKRDAEFVFFEGGDLFLRGHRDQPVDELVGQLVLNLRVLFGVYRDDAVGIEQELVTLDHDL